ncbi:hypothetical protein ABTY98_28650 [Streptomyces sp. NPDC096040]|uniref:hypothetical protein n=1 Tax=Streptomyces sp. NPDC096040 TaxID=3155541 RepID=UPI00332AAE3B
MATPVTRIQLEERLHTHLTNHYMQLHGTLVSIALGAAAFAASSLATATPGQADSRGILWVMWVGGLLAIAVVYAGTVTGAFTLPAGIPSLWDLVFPLLISLAQFMVFGVLTRTVAPFTNPDKIVQWWFFGMAGVGGFAAIAIMRARHLVKGSSYETDLGRAISYYKERLKSDAMGASLLALISSLAGSLVASGVIHLTSAWTYVFVSAAVAVLAIGVWMHHITGRKLGKKLRQP